MTETYRQKPLWFLQKLPKILFKTIFSDRIPINLNFNL
ncbi:hypothetical protein KORDIASMS9_01722 [Kordia sp. SMS9]|nr:hypothetical protein KORDIASMS9_01722 [Kordia sp. SMS9]